MLDIASSDSSEVSISCSGGGTSVTFTDGDLGEKNCIVSGKDDSIVDGSVVSTLTVSVNDASTTDNAFDGLDSQEVEVTSQDSNVAGFEITTGNTCKIKIKLK